MNRLIVAIALFSLAEPLVGCAPRVITATPFEYSVSAGNIHSGNPGQMAAAHCAKYDKFASFVGKNGVMWMFSCVSKN